jgi:hypothetical protein
VGGTWTLPPVFAYALPVRWNLRTLVAAGLAALALAACAGEGDSGGGPLVGSAPPSIRSSEAVWVRPVGADDWGGLAGQVVFLEFGYLR